jgi:hypothetical protein
MRQIETMKGRGVVTSSSGEHAMVEYELHTTQEDAYGQTVPLPSTDGWINPVCFFGVQHLTLTLKDGRTAKFIYRNDSGAVHVNWIGQE